MSAGELKIGPYSLCSHQPEGVLKFEQGDLFIVTGHVDEWNDHHIATSDGFYFKLIDGVVRRSDLSTPPRQFQSRSELDLGSGPSGTSMKIE